MIVTRLAPSHGGGNVTSGALRLGVAVWAMGVLPALVATGAATPVEHVGSETPGSEVSRQQDTNPLRKTYITTARTNPVPIKIEWATDGRLKVRSFWVRSDLF